MPKKKKEQNNESVEVPEVREETAESEVPQEVKEEKPVTKSVETQAGKKMVIKRN